MEINSIINEILHIPKRFNALGNNKSAYSLLKQTGYFEKREEVSESLIKVALGQHSGYVDLWLRWSADKRSSSGWFFNPNDHQKYVVAYSNLEKGVIERMEYNDIISACAAFIKREIESIAQS